MTDPHPADDAPPLAFVLRLRRSAGAGGARTIIDVDDVQTAETWRVTTLDAAFARVRAAVDQHLGGAVPPGKPN